MEPPTFDYRTTPSSRTAGQQPMHESDTLASTRPIESASASTVPQTNSSNFAYILTGVALGIVSLLAIAFALLLFGAVGTAVNSSYAYDYDPSFYEDDWDDWEHFQNDHEHEFDQLEEELMNELMMDDGYSA